MYSDQRYTNNVVTLLESNLQQGLKLPLRGASADRREYPIPAAAEWRAARQLQLRIPVNLHTANEWFQTTCFSQSVGFVFSNAGVGDGGINGPRYQDWDMTFAKAVRLTEGMQLQFQASFFNIFNHVNYQTPDTNVQDGSFGHVSNDFLPRMDQLGMTFSF